MRVTSSNEKAGEADGSARGPGSALGRDGAPRARQLPQVASVLRIRRRLRGSESMAQRNRWSSALARVGEM